MTPTDIGLFHLVRCALKGATPDISVFESFDSSMWEELLKTAQKQAVIAIAYDAMIRLPDSFRPPKPLQLQWFYWVTKIEEHHAQLDRVLLYVSRLLRGREIPFVLLKGQGVAALYPRCDHRQGGDLDLYMGSDYDKAKALFEEHGYVVDTSYPKHYALEIDRVRIELHLSLCEELDGDNRATLLRLYEEELPRSRTYCVEDEAITIPSHRFNQIHILFHGYQHFIENGIGLRHLCDWQLAMQQVPLDRSWYASRAKSLHMTHFSKAASALLQQHLGGDPAALPDSRGGKRGARLLLDKLLAGGNFDKHRVKKPLPKGLWARRFHKLGKDWLFFWRYRALAPNYGYQLLWRRIFKFIGLNRRL